MAINFATKTSGTGVPAERQNKETKEREPDLGGKKETGFEGKQGKDWKSGKGKGLKVKMDMNAQVIVVLQDIITTVIDAATPPHSGNGAGWRKKR